MAVRGPLVGPDLTGDPSWDPSWSPGVPTVRGVSGVRTGRVEEYRRRDMGPVRQVWCTLGSPPPRAESVHFHLTSGRRAVRRRKRYFTTETFRRVWVDRYRWGAAALLGRDGHSVTSPGNPGPSGEWEKNQRKDYFYLVNRNGETSGDPPLDRLRDRLSTTGVPKTRK